jgi:4-hydroxymandelate oxidase
VNELINLDDFEQAALPRLPAGVRGYYAGGAGDEHTLAANRRAWNDWDVHYRVLRDVADRSLATRLLGRALEWPVLIAPTACQRMAHDDGELATARAATATGTTMVLSTLSNHGVDAVAPVAHAGLWFQLYVYRDRGVTRELVARARAAGCGALVLTVDMPVAGRRERDIRQQFTFPQQLPLGNLAGLTSLAAAPAAGADFIGYIDGLFDPALSWRDLEWLVADAGMPVLVKGVVRADDAVAALRHGAAGIIVSNHGGRQLDGAPATAHVLPRRARCRPRPRRAPQHQRCWWTAASAAAWTCCAHSRSAPTPCCSAGRSCGGSRSVANTACAACSSCCGTSFRSQWRSPAAPVSRRFQPSSSNGAAERPYSASGDISRD